MERSIDPHISVRPELPKKPRKKAPPRQSAEELLRISAITLPPLLKLLEAGEDPKIEKKIVRYIMGIPGYAPGSLPRKYQIVREYEHLYDPDFPKPLNPGASRLVWSLRALLAYKHKKYGF